jgi:hypothetical protein
MLGARLGKRPIIRAAARPRRREWRGGSSGMENGAERTAQTTGCDEWETVTHGRLDQVELDGFDGGSIVSEIVSQNVGETKKHLWMLRRPID